MCPNLSKDQVWDWQGEAGSRAKGLELSKGSDGAATEGQTLEPGNRVCP